MTPKKSPKKTSKSPAPKSAPKAQKPSPSKTRPAPARPTGKVPQRGQADDDGAERSAQGGPVSPSELSPEVLEFLRAIDRYKREHRRPFPSWSEIFEIVKSLGYQKSA